MEMFLQLLTSILPFKILNNILPKVTLKFPEMLEPTIFCLCSVWEKDFQIPNNVQVICRDNSKLVGKWNQL